jgi:hypothetical protein
VTPERLAALIRERKLPAARSEPKVVRVGTKKPVTLEEQLAALLAAAAGSTTRP